MTSRTINTEVIQCITTEQAWHYMILPFHKENNRLDCYVAIEKMGNHLEEELEVLLGFQINLQKVPIEELKKAIARYYRQPTDARTQVRGVDLKVEDSRDFLFNLVREAKQLGSSDIHLEPFEKTSRLRMRIDGKLIERYVLEKATYPGLVNKIKIHANLDIAEKRLPQDGRIFFNTEATGKLDIRVSVLPTLYGEKVVMRLLGSDAANIKLKELGFGGEDLENYLEGVNRPNGIVLISGPTGSGKTTTLYATLQVLNQSTRNIVTIEDPIEYTLEGINQVQLKENIGLDFPSAMRTFLRQDPDIIMVGEIRDQATANMAIRASLTGHLVLSTVHTNSAWGIVARMIDMGIPSYLLADTLNTAVAQRLVRLLCPSCKVEKNFDAAAYPKTFQAPHQLSQHFTPEGCEHCFYSGYKGRKAIYEVIPINNDLAHRIKERELNIENLLAEQGIQKLSKNAFRLFEAGLTSIEEIYPILAAS